MYQLLDHLQCLGLSINMQKSMLHSSQGIKFLGMNLNSCLMWAHLSRARMFFAQLSRTIQTWKIGFSEVLSEVAGTDGVVCQQWCLASITKRVFTLTHWRSVSFCLWTGISYWCWQFVNSHLNCGTDMLSRGGTVHREWRRLLCAQFHYEGTCSLKRWALYDIPDQRCRTGRSAQEADVDCAATRAGY